METESDNERSTDECNLCYKGLNSKDRQIRKTYLENTKLIFISCCRHLDKRYISNDFFNSGTNLSLQLCQRCYICADQLCQMNAKLEQIETKIKEFVKNFTVDLLEDRKLNDTGAEVPCNIKTEPEVGSPSTPDDFEGDYVPESICSSSCIAETQPEKCPATPEPEWMTTNSNEDIVTIKEELEEHSAFDDDNESAGNNYSMDDDDFGVEEAPEGLVDSQEKDKPINRSLGRMSTRASNKSKLPMLNVAIKLKRLGNLTPSKTTVTNSRKHLSRGKDNSESSNTVRKSQRFAKPDRKGVAKKIAGNPKELAGRSTLKSSKNSPTKRLSTSKCKLCGFAFSDSLELKEHLTVHAEGRPYICNECNFPFKDQDTLNRHKKGAHSNTRNFQCAHCENAYFYRRNLKEHIAKSGHHEKGILCDLCEQSLKGNRTGKSHQNDGKSVKISSRPQEANIDRDDVYECYDDVIVESDNEGNRISIDDLGDEDFFNVESEINESEDEAPVYKSPTKSDKRTVANLNTKTRTNVLRNTANKRKKTSSKCKICGTMFSTSSKLKIHLLIHRDERPFACDECNFPFKDQDSLKRHQKGAHLSERDFLCPHCDSSYKYRRNLRDHIKGAKHHVDPLNGEQLDNFDNCGLCDEALSVNLGNKTSRKKSKGTNEDGEIIQDNYVCDMCGKSLSSAHKLTLHIRRLHTEGGKNFPCDTCEMKFYTHSDAKKHMEVHSTERKYQCPICLKYYKYQRNVREHIVNIHPGELHLLDDQMAKEYEMRVSRQRRQPRHKRKHCCPDCDQTFPDKLSLYCHSFEHLPTETEITCYECGTKLANLNALKIHMLTHTDKQSFLCLYCGEQFTNQTSQTEHEIVHYNLDEDEIKEKYFPCLGENCGKIFISERRLKKHSETHNNERKFGPCEVCGLTFKTLSIFKTHQRIHLAEKTKHQCSICNKYVTSKGSLNRHMYRHSGVKRFMCYCGKSFTTKSGLTTHSIYHREKPHLCSECGQSFYTKTKLKEHTRIHTGLLFYCEQGDCDKGFTTTTLLKQHILAHEKSSQNRSKRVRKRPYPMRKKRLQLKRDHETEDENDRDETQTAVDQILQFQCTICDEWFATEQDINEHVNNHNYQVS